MALKAIALTGLVAITLLPCSMAMEFTAGTKGATNVDAPNGASSGPVLLVGYGNPKPKSRVKAAYTKVSGTTDKAQAFYVSFTKPFQNLVNGYKQFEMGRVCKGEFDAANCADQGVMETTEVMEAGQTQKGTQWYMPRKAALPANGVPPYADWTPSSPAECAMICDHVDADLAPADAPKCYGFTHKYGQCWFISKVPTDPTTPFVDFYYEGGPNLKDWTTYIKHGHDPAFPNPKTSLACTAYHQIGLPCTQHVVAYHTADAPPTTADDMTTGVSWNLALDISTNETWKGSAPGAFDTNLVAFTPAGLELGAKHDPSFLFPATDAGCGCSYDTYTTSMVAGKDDKGYGIYETTFRSTATEFVNAFWMQGDNAEINVLKVEGSVATASWHCFADQDAQTTNSVTISSSFDVAVDHTATLVYSKEEIIVLIDGLIVLQEATPSCMKDQTMKPILSVEVGDQLPSTAAVASGALFGKMTVGNFRAWNIVGDRLVSPTGNGIRNGRETEMQVSCKGNGLPSRTGAFTADLSARWAGADGWPSAGGHYQGPVPAGKWSAHCGLRLDNKRRLSRVNGVSIEGCGAYCDTWAGCNAFWYEGSSSSCRLYADVRAQAKADQQQGGDGGGNALGWHNTAQVIEQCTDVDTATAAAPACVFPFTYNETEHTECTTGDLSSALFCATETLDTEGRILTGNFNTWGTCADSGTVVNRTCTRFVPRATKWNVVFTKPRVRDADGFDTYPPTKEIVCGTATNARGFTRECFSAPFSLGASASLGLDGNDVVDVGCPYGKSENRKDGVLSPLACTKAKHFKHPWGPPEGAALNTAISGTVELYTKPPGSILEGWWNTHWADKNLTMMDKTTVLEPMGALTIDVCIALCEAECSCSAAGWRTDKKECNLGAKPSTRNWIVGSAQAWGKVTTPIKPQSVWVTYVKPSSAAGCNTTALWDSGFVASDVAA